MKPSLLAALVAALAVAVPAKTRRLPVVRPQATPALQDTLHAGSAVLAFEVADDEAERVQGLSGRTSMGWDQGMLFSFPDADRRSFWMIDCHFDLDIAYIAPDGTVRDIQAMVIQPGATPDQLARYPSATNDVMYALEVNRGWFAARGVTVGQKLPAVLRHRATR